MKKVLQYLDNLKSTSSTKNKINMLEGYLKNKWFRKTVQYALDPNKTFSVKKLPKAEDAFFKKQKITKTQLFECLHQLSEKLGASDFEKQELANLCYNKETREVVTRIINKKLRCGASAKLINKARPGTIPVFPYQRCSTKSKLKNITYPAYAQVKMDGLFCNVILEDKEVKFLSRTGSEFKFKTTTLEKVFKKVFFTNQDIVVMGEFLVYRDDTLKEICDRKTGNGILNKALKGTITKEESNRVFFVAWDILSLFEYKEEKSSYNYLNNFSILTDYLDLEINSGYYTKKRAKRIKLIETREVASEQEAMSWASELIQNGEEGIIIKDFFSAWKNGTSTKMVKIKSEKVCELQIIGWQFGDSGGKYGECLGAFKCSSSDRKLIVDISGGLTDEFRGVNYFDENGNAVINKKRVKELDSYIGKIAGVIFESVIDRKKEKIKSLFLPRFENPIIREDKKEADTLKYIEGIK